MSPARNKAVVRRLVEEVLLGGQLDLVDQIFDPAYVVHDPSNPSRPGGIEGARMFLSMFHTGMSDQRYLVEDMIAEDDLVMYRWTLSGRQTGPFMGLPPSGRSFSITGIDAFRLRDGKIVESWAAADALSMLVQLGVVQLPGPPQ